MEAIDLSKYNFEVQTKNLKKKKKKIKKLN